MAIGDIIVGIDIGTSKVCTVVGEVNNFGQIETICTTSTKCSGLKKGKIINEEEISLSIAKTIKDAEDEADFKATFAQTILLDKDSIGKTDKDKNTVELNAYVVDYVGKPKIDGKKVEVKKNVTYPKAF